jgi:hypothetical protein
LRSRSRTTLHYVSFDGTALFSVRGGTFPDAGEVALWTKADRATYSETISITPLRLIGRRNDGVHDEAAYL